MVSQLIGVGSRIYLEFESMYKILFLNISLVDNYFLDYRRTMM